MTIERTQAIRWKLEEMYTHVTFVKTAEPTRYPKYYGDVTVWYVGEDMERLEILESWEIDEVLAQLELRKIMKAAKGAVNEQKAELFLELMINGKLPIDAKLYKKHTARQLQAIYEA